MVFNYLKVLLVLSIICLTNASLYNRLDCHLENDFKMDEKFCEERGCIWDPHKRTDDFPVCYLNTNKIGYKRLNDIQKTKTGLKIDLILKETAKSLFKSAQIENLNVEFTYLSNRILRFKIFDPNNPRYEVPIQNNFPLLQNTVTKIEENDRFYDIELSKSVDDFNFSVIRKSTKTKIFDTSIGGLIYSDQFIQIASNLATNNVYGLGENTHHSLRLNFSQYKRFPLFTQDHPTGQEDINYYGVHPFYTVLEQNGESHGILLLNSNAMDYTLLPEPGLSFKTLGGVLDFFVFVGDNPGHVIQLYTSLIGRPTMPPFWGLGFQLSRCGHPNTSEVESVIDRNLRSHIPLDVMYLDFDYMNDSRDFSLNYERFGKLPELIHKTKLENNLRWAFIVDPGIEGFKDPNVNPSFTDGYQRDVFIKWDKSVPNNQRYNPSNEPLDRDVFYGKVWPSAPVAYPDFFKNVTHEWWQKWFQYFYNDLDIKFDALWIDMNEPANQIDNIYSCPNNKYDYPDFRIKVNYADNGAKNLSHNTLCMVTAQGEDNQYLHYNVHSLYGLTEMIATQKAIHSVTGKRGFVLSRSTYVSSGRYGAHWLGDNTSKWPHMKYSIIGSLEMNLFGIPFVGPDICGFINDTTPELCKRWSALGAFYPFSRNHNGASLDQDPGVWALRGHPEVTEAAKYSLRIRYQLLPYLYTLFFKANTRGHIVARPLFHEFSTDNNTFGIDEQFMLGPSILISPFLYENQREVKAYLPNDIWYDMIANLTKVEKTGFVSLPDNKFGVPPLHVRGGSIIPISGKQEHHNTESIRKNDIQLLVFPGTDKTASGDLFWDDGESIDSIEKNNYNFYSFHFDKNCSLVIRVEKSGYSESLTFDSIAILGTNGDSVEATLDGKPIEFKLINSFLEFNEKIDLKSKKVGEKWTLSWKSIKTNSCNLI